jgi:hypothetical protein
MAIAGFKPFVSILRLWPAKTQVIPFHRDAGAAKSGELTGGGS